MLKFLIILGLVFYLVYRVTGFLTKGLFTASSNRTRTKTKIRPDDGNVDVDYIPKDQKGKSHKDGGSHKGGEYVDFEEVE